MKAAVISTPGAVPIYTDFAEPVMGEGFQLVDLVAAGIHPVVKALAGGEHYGSTDSWPLIPGVDAVARTTDGALIYTGYTPPPYGTFAERMAVPSQFRLELPPGADPVVIAGGMNPGLSSWMPIASRLDELGDAGLATVLVLGATGAAGQLAVQNSLIQGASRVVAVGRDAERLAATASFGADPVRLSGDRDADAGAITAALAGESPTLVLDFVWGPIAEAAFMALGRHGLDEDSADILHVEIGESAGTEAALPASLLRSRRYRVQGSGAGSFSMERLFRELPRYIELLASGQVVAPVRALPLSDIATAWASGSGERLVVTP